MKRGFAVAVVIVAVVVLSPPLNGLSQANAAASQPPEQFTVSGAYAPPEPSWSPDGKHLAYTVATAAGRTVYTVDLASGTARALCKGSHPSWSPSGDMIALLGDWDELYVVPAEGGEARKVVAGPTWPNDSALAWSPDGRYLAFQKPRHWQPAAGPHKGSTVSCGDVYVADPALGQVRQLTRFRELFRAEVEEVYQVNVDVRGLTADGKQIIVDRPDIGERPAGLYAIDVTTGESTVLAPGLFAFVCLSPEATRMVGLKYERLEDTSLRKSLVEVELGSGSTRTIRAFTERPPWRLTVSWAHKLIVGAGRTFTYKLTRFDLDTGESEVMTEDGVLEATPSCSPDGSLVAFYRHENGKSSLCLMRPDGTAARRLSAAQE